MNAALFSSKRVDWETPKPFFADLAREFPFNLDVCATKENAKCSRFFSPAENGLVQSWGESICWMNPPYGREIGLWTRKAAAEGAGRSAVVVGLLPARTDTAWWHRDVLGTCAEIRFIRGRLTFEGAPFPAPFPSAIVIWGRK